MNVDRLICPEIAMKVSSSAVLVEDRNSLDGAVSVSAAIESASILEVTTRTAS